MEVGDLADQGQAETPAAARLRLAGGRATCRCDEGGVTTFTVELAALG